MSQSNRVPITVSVSDSHLEKLKEVAAQLRAAGMSVEHSLDAIGTISGHVEQDRLAGLAKVPGVAAVEPERTFQLPPPGSKIQ